MRQFEEEKRNHWWVDVHGGSASSCCHEEVPLSGTCIWNLCLAIPKNIGQCFVNKARLMIERDLGPSLARLKVLYR